VDADIAVRQIVGLIAGGLLMAAGAYSAARGLDGLTAVHLVSICVIAVSVVFIGAGVGLWHRKVYG
jgi:hypothetical protein